MSLRGRIICSNGEGVFGDVYTNIQWGGRGSALTSAQIYLSLRWEGGDEQVHRDVG